MTNTNNISSIHINPINPSNLPPLSGGATACSSSGCVETPQLPRSAQHESTLKAPSPLDSKSIEFLLQVNSAAVASMLNGQEEAALSLFHEGLQAANLPGLLHANTGLLPQLLSSQKTHFDPQALKISLPSLHQGDVLLASVDTTHCAPQHDDSLPPRDSAYAVYNRALLFNDVKGTSTDQSRVCAVSHHIAPVLLYNFGLMVHQRAKSETDFLLAHELYRTSLFLMEENTIRGWYDKCFDLLLLALFNNLCEINSSFYQQNRVALCREKLLLVFLNMDVKRVTSMDYSFFYEQLVFSAEQFPTAASAA